MSRPLLNAEEVRCPCGKKFGVKSPHTFILELAGKFRLEADLAAMPPGWLRATCEHCGKVKKIA